MGTRVMRNRGGFRRSRFVVQVIAWMTCLGLVATNSLAQAPGPRKGAVRPQSAPGPRNGGNDANGDEVEQNNRPKGGLTAEGNIILDYKEEELITIISSLGALTGKNFDVDPEIAKTTVTVISHKPIPPDMAYAVLESLLTSRGFKLVPVLDGNLIKVVAAQKLPHNTPLIIGDEKAPEGYDNFMTQVVPVEHVAVDDVRDLLQQYTSETGKVNSYPRTNTLIITDVAEAVRRMLRLLAEIDIAGYDTDQEIFPLQYTRAEVMATQIQEVLLGPEGQAGPSRGPGRAPTQPGSAPATTTPATPSRRATVPGQQQGGSSFGSRETVLRIVPDERMNALIVVASAPIMEQVRDLIDKLDAPTPYESNNMHIYPLLNADAEKVGEALSGLTGTTPRQTGGGGAGGAAGAAGGGGGGGAGGATAEIQPFEKKVQITVYEQSNMLLIIASPQDYKLLQEIIAQLDVPQRQVHVEAVIMDVIINDSFSLSVETAGLTNESFLGLNNVVKLANLITQGPLAVTGTGSTLAIIDGTTDIAVPDGAGGFATQTIPNVPLLINALESVTNLDILSQPSLTTVDNEESDIVVGQEVPFITGGSRSDATVPGGSFYNTRVDREDVGIKLHVKPQISEGDYVFLDMEVEVSSTIASPVGADVNVVGPTLQKSNVKNKMVVKDGSLGVVGGLISESTDRNRNQAPLLGDLPLVGWLFKNKGAKRGKRNLVVLVTPYIVKESPEFDRVTQYRIDEFRDANIDVLFEKGFIKKTRKKHYMREKYSPSDAHIQRMEGPNMFEKGGEPLEPDEAS